MLSQSAVTQMPAMPSIRRAFSIIRYIRQRNCTDQPHPPNARDLDLPDVLIKSSRGEQFLAFDSGQALKTAFLSTLQPGTLIWSEIPTRGWLMERSKRFQGSSTVKHIGMHFIW